MFDELFTSRQSLDRHSHSPLLEERLRYLTHCRAQGSTTSSLRLIAQHLLVFIEQFYLEAEPDVGLEQTQKAANVWVGSRPQAHGMTNCWYGRMRFTSDAKKWLAFLRRLRLSAVPTRPYTRLIDAFCDALSRHDFGQLTHGSPASSGFRCLGRFNTISTTRLPNTAITEFSDIRIDEAFCGPIHT
jgi:hypothetical protein